MPKKSKDVAKMRAEKAADVDVAMNCIDKRDLDELRRLAHPPADVRDVTDAILGLKGVPKQQWSWPVAQQMMKDLNSFKNDLKHLKTQIEDGVLPTKNVALVRPLLELDHIKDASIMLKKSRAASGLCETVVSLVAFHDLLVLLSAPVLPEKTVSFHDVEQATEAVNVAIQQLATANFNTIRSPPPAAVKVTMEAVCVLLGEKPDWPTACKLLAGAGFLHSLTHFDRDHIPIHRISALQSYLLDSNFQQDSVAKASKAAAAICSWVRAVHAYARLKKGKSSGGVPHHAAARHVPVESSAHHDVAAHPIRERSSPMSHWKKEDACKFWTEYFYDALQAGGPAVGKALAHELAIELGLTADLPLTRTHVSWNPSSKDASSMHLEDSLISDRKSPAHHNVNSHESDVVHRLTERLFFLELEKAYDEDVNSEARKDDEIARLKTQLEREHVKNDELERRVEKKKETKTQALFPHHHPFKLAAVENKLKESGKMAQEVARAQSEAARRSVEGADNHHMATEIKNLRQHSANVLEERFKREKELKSQMDELQAKYEAANQRASDKESASFQLLDSKSGHVVERKGIGMVVRIERNKPNGEYQVKQLISGGSAAKSSIKVGDTIIEVDGHPISTFPIAQVQDLILGPEGTSVTITGIANDVRYSETLVRGEAQHKRPFEEESKDAITALNSVHHDAKVAKAVRKGLEDQISAAKSKISELEALVQELDKTQHEASAHALFEAEGKQNLMQQLGETSEAWTRHPAAAEEQSKRIESKRISALKSEVVQLKTELKGSAGVRFKQECKVQHEHITRLKTQAAKDTESLANREAEVTELKKQLQYATHRHGKKETKILATLQDINQKMSLKQMLLKEENNEKDAIQTCIRALDDENGNLKNEISTIKQELLAKQARKGIEQEKSKLETRQEEMTSGLEEVREAPRQEEETAVKMRLDAGENCNTWERKYTKLMDRCRELEGEVRQWQKECDVKELNHAQREIELELIMLHKEEACVLKNSRLKRAAERILRRFMHRDMAVAFKSWRHQTRTQSRAEEICNRVLGRWTHGASSTVFTCWHTHTKAQRRMRGICKNVSVRITNFTCAASFESWRTHSQEQRRVEAICRKIMTHFVHNSEGMAFVAWKESSRKQKQMHGICKNAIVRMTKSSLECDCSNDQIFAPSNNQERDCSNNQVFAPPPNPIESQPPLPTPRLHLPPPTIKNVVSSQKKTISHEIVGSESPFPVRGLRSPARGVGVGKAWHAMPSVVTWGGGIRRSKTAASYRETPSQGLTGFLIFDTVFAEMNLVTRHSRGVSGRLRKVPAKDGVVEGKEIFVSESPFPVRGVLAD